MEDIISIHTPIIKAREILKAHCVGLPRYGEIVLWMILKEFPNQKAKIIGFGDTAQLVEVDEN